MRSKLFFLLIVSLSWSVGAWADQLYKCTVTNVYQLDGAGAFVETDWAAMVKQLDEEIIFDSKTGLLRFSGGEGSWEFQVLEVGNEHNSLKAVLIFQGPAAVVLETFSIKTFSSLEFVYDTGSSVRTGRCVVF